MTQVVELDKKQYQDYELVFEYETAEQYSVKVDVPAAVSQSTSIGKSWLLR